MRLEDARGDFGCTGEVDECEKSGGESRLGMLLHQRRKDLRTPKGERQLARYPSAG